MSGVPAISIKGVTVRFGGVVANESVSLDVPERSIFAVIGPNGAGKTTLFNAVTGVHPPTEGEVEFFGCRAQLPFDASVAFKVVMAGVLTSIGFVLGLNAQEFWKRVFDETWEYGQPYSWGGGCVASVKALSELSWLHSWLPAGLGLVVGAGTMLLLWTRGRGGSDVVARKGIARTFQNIRLFTEMSLVENVLVGMDYRLRTGFWAALLRFPSFGRERRTTRAEAISLLKFVGLESRKAEAAGSLSYGHRRRLEIARALASKPRILLLDEPAAGMNPQEISELMALIRRIRDLGITVVLIEHHMKLVMGISDRIAVLQYGRKIAEGTPDAVRADRKCIEAYLGAEEPGT